MVASTPYAGVSAQGGGKWVLTVAVRARGHGPGTATPGTALWWWKSRWPSLLHIDKQSLETGMKFLSTLKLGKTLPRSNRKEKDLKKKNKERKLLLKSSLLYLWKVLRDMTQDDSW